MIFAVFDVSLIACRR